MYFIEDTFVQYSIIFKQYFNIAHYKMIICMNEVKL